MSPGNYPAAVAYIVNLVMSAVVAFGFLPQTTAHYVATVAVAATSLVVVFLVRPVAVAAATGAFNTLITAVAAFGFHLTDSRIAAVTAVFGLVVAFITHQLVIPASALAAGKTGNEVALGRKL